MKKNLKLLKIKSIGKRIFKSANGKTYEIFECNSPISSRRSAKDFIDVSGKNIIINGKKCEIAGIGFRIPWIYSGELIEIAIEKKKGGKVNVKNKKHQSKSK